ncbi:MAG: ATP-binding protein [candidate division KSB1 bacterium]|nr:ATP-binding protein [candidate division KSB1 bacterium]
MNQTIQIKKPLPQLHSKLIFPIAAALALILLISTILDIYGTKRELRHILQEQSLALLTAIEAGSNNAVESFALVEELVAERLLNNARFIERMDYSGRLSAEELGRIAEENNLFRIAVYSADGELQFSSRTGRGWGNISPIRPDLLQKINEPGNEELIMGVHSTRFGAGSRFAVAKRRRKGGVIMVSIDSQQLLEFRKSIGIGRLIREIGKNPGIAYIALQDTAHVVVATANVDSLSAIEADPFLAKIYSTQTGDSRYLVHKKEKVFEVVYPFFREDKLLLRIALRTGHLREAERASLTRSVLVSFLLLILGTIMADRLISSRNYQQLQSAYQTMETYTGSILAAMSDAVIAVGRNGEIILLNRAAQTLLGKKDRPLLGEICEEKLSPLCRYIDEAKAQGRSLFFSEQKIETDAGEKILDLSIDVLKAEDGQIDSFVLVAQDVTERVLLRENAKRSDRITAMGQLASGVAHEIRNPLNAIGMIAQRLAIEFKPTADEEEYSRLASTLVHETHRINQIIDQFLTFARPAPLLCRPIHLQNLLAEVASLLKEEAVENRITVKTACDDLPAVQADGDKLKQAFLNLGRNALQACRPGGHVTIICRDEGDRVVIRFIDDGVGIPAENLDKIFNLYFTTKDKGSGIGLSIVQQIISQHNGVIQVDSRENQGTTVTIILPKE